MEISIVIPVYRSSLHLEKLYAKLVESLEQINKPFEVIFVEDCGGDRSWETLRKISMQDSRVTAIKLSKNFGQHAATICGIAQAKGEWIVTIDDDLEQSPEDIVSLYNEALKGYDLVYGVFEERSHSIWRNFTSHCARKLFTMAISSLNYEYTSFRIIKSSIAKELQQFDSPYPFIDGYLSWITNNYSTVKVAHSERGSGVSNYTFSKLLKHTINISISFSEIPLKLSSWMGLFTSVFGLVWVVIILIQKIIGAVTVSGYASTMAAILFIGGIQLMVLGVIGEYIYRINFKTSKKPLYLVGQKMKKENRKNT
ncbi:MULTISPECIES: glycosyltransferase family 2 protein [Lysinibacillus]|uniref:glycosyltransferase family 2 protein n=1 Tax=Lysinibacillus TaxID=400634 RepID=UPI0021A2964A|nr:glycosyltransferase family 2 protein [Lysinibacillus capsici]MCT1539293.1 glycosyltransferase family 2 protein [Lysinibacillus capsici]MCT1570639.1 glycosyltransferase family 2 protein [Lysinibacillus capsici]MCT1647453.1 glycosyltransferase family 2 protein [Lysinibacillus capsici]MCT1726269.1 glycosyltransferase family 2 protein [Lysinibacillus capsici]MCT1783373.1 glycosyltransferase family 2 protein [Lysinibacillus capsici]